MAKKLEMLDNWRDRTKRMICNNCMYYVPKEGQVGRCRRRCPKVERGYPVVYETD